MVPFVYCLLYILQYIQCFFLHISFFFNCSICYFVLLLCEFQYCHILVGMGLCPLFLQRSRSYCERVIFLSLVQISLTNPRVCLKMSTRVSCLIFFSLSFLFWQHHSVPRCQPFTPHCAACGTQALLRTLPETRTAYEYEDIRTMQ